MPDVTAQQLNAPRAVADPTLGRAYLPDPLARSVMLTFHLRWLPQPEEPGTDVDPAPTYRADHE